MLTLPSPAKLNLFLHITGKRADGYHNLHTYFLLIDAADTLNFEVLANGQVELTITGSPALSAQEASDNLIVKAAQLLQKHVGAGVGTKQGVHIHLTKVLPMGGGVGGGSSNAATTLLALNQLWQLGLSLDELAQLSAQLGADVPVFVRGSSAFAQGVGEVLTASSPFAYMPKDAAVVVLCPAASVSTAALFAHPDLAKNTPVLPDSEFALQDVRFVNSFEPLVLASYPPVANAHQYLRQHPKKHDAYMLGEPRLTGTGACVFAVFTDAHAAQVCLKNAPCAGFIAKGVAHSPVHELLN